MVRVGGLKKEGGGADRGWGTFSDNKLNTQWFRCPHPFLQKLSLPKTERKITWGFEVFTSPSADLSCFLQEPLAHYEKKWCYRDSRQASIINIKTFDVYMGSCKLNLQKMFFYTWLVYCWFNKGCFGHW